VTTGIVDALRRISLGVRSPLGDSIRGVDTVRFARLPASPSAAARCPSQRSSCRPRHRVQAPANQMKRRLSFLRDIRPNRNFSPLRCAKNRAGWLVAKFSCLPCACHLPSSVSTSSRPLPPSRNSDLDPGMAARIRVPSLRFFTTATVSSKTEGSGLLHPDSGHGVRWVSVEHVVAVRRRRGHGLHSRQRDDPSKVYSSSVAVPNRLGRLPAHRSFQTRIAASRTANPPRRSPASWDASRGTTAAPMSRCTGISSRPSQTRAVALAVS
jgi:hypothetical protein